MPATETLVAVLLPPAESRQALHRMRHARRPELMFLAQPKTIRIQYHDNGHVSEKDLLLSGMVSTACQEARHVRAHGRCYPPPDRPQGLMGREGTVITAEC